MGEASPQLSQQDKARILAVADGAQSRRSRNTVQIILGASTLRGLSIVAIMDGAYTRLPLIDIATEIFKAYRDDPGLKKGRRILVTRRNLKR